MGRKGGDRVRPDGRRAIAGFVTVVLVTGLLVTGHSARAVGSEDAEGSAPLSAIPWLSETLQAPPSPVPRRMPSAPGTPSGGSATQGTGAQGGGIEVTPINPPDRGATGLLSPRSAGLPADLWSGSDAAALAQTIRAMPRLGHPALQDLFEALLLIEADPPPGAGEAFLLARVDALLMRGALDPAQALLERAGPDTPELFRRWFDVLLLGGTEDRACAVLAAKPDLSPNYATRIFCLARAGRWYTAALMLETATALGAIDGPTRDRLARFLDPEIFEGEPSPPLPDPVTPLDFRLLEAVGEPVPTGRLPVAFAHDDLRHVIGWKAQIEAAERLARVGALPVNRLLGIYTARLPAASGGVWDRVALVQSLDIALTARNADDVARLLPQAEEAMHAAGLDAVFAGLFAPRLTRIDLPPGSAAQVARLALVSNTGAAFTVDPIDAAPTADAPDQPPLEMPADLVFAAALARGDTPAVAAPTPLAAAVRRGLQSDSVPDRYAGRIAADQLGAALLDALGVLGEGMGADPVDAGDAVALLRHAGLDETARHVALQVLLLDLRG